MLGEIVPRARARSRRIDVEVSVALALAVVRYGLGVSHIVGSEIQLWRERAARIEDPALRALALAKLEQEGFNARAAAMFAVFAPRAQRRSATRAIVALEVLFDYLDGRTEPPGFGKPLEWRREKFAVFQWAITQGSEAPRMALDDRSADGVYLAALAERIRESLAELPNSPASRIAMANSAARASEAQARMHARHELGEQQLHVWARTAAAGSQLAWQEYLAGACASVLSAHALIASVGTEPGATEVAEIDAFYLRLGAIATLLDRAVDYERDRGAQRAEIPPVERAKLESSLLCLTAATLELALTSRARRRELAMLAGVLGYYATAHGGAESLAAPIAAELRRRYPSLLAPASGLMTSWRALRRVRGLA